MELHCVKSRCEKVDGDRVRVVPTGTWGWQRFAMGLAGGEHWYRAMIESGAATWESWEDVTT